LHRKTVLVHEYNRKRGEREERGERGKEEKYDTMPK